MARVFAGFTPEQLGKIDPILDGVDSDTQQQIIAANPSLAARVGKLSNAAQKKVYAANGGYIKGYAAGGMPGDDTTPKPEENDIANTGMSDTLTKSGETAGKLVETSIKDPSELVTETKVTKFTDEQKEAGKVSEDLANVEPGLPETKLTTAATPTDVAAPEKIEATTYETEAVTPEVQKTLDTITAATGKPSDEALVEAAQMDPNELAQLGLTVDQIKEAQTVKAPEKRKVEEGELVTGTTVDLDRAAKYVNFEAVTGAPSTDATVQGQLTGLMQDFEGTTPPAWAAGAMRTAAAKLAARGLTSSSMAGQAIVQAAMESALPIAQQDAKTVAEFELKNLSNKQQAALFAAEQRANFLKLEFDQEFETRVLNAAKITEIANTNYDAEVQIALENARMAQTVDIANLDARNAKILADAAAMTNVDIANLNNRQAAAVQRANAFLEMDMTNLNNEQTTRVFKGQALINSLLSDRAEENAAKQFNASSKTQTDQFFADLGSRISLANAAEKNLTERYNAGEANVFSQFSSTLQENRNQFVATNRLLIGQANATWMQNVTTTENAADNQANRDNAQRTNEFTALGYETAIQQYRDLMSYAWKTDDNDAQRGVSLAIAKLQADTAKYATDKQAAAAAAETASSKSNAFWGAVGSFVGSIDWT